METTAKTTKLKDNTFIPIRLDISIHIKSPDQLDKLQLDLNWIRHSNRTLCPKAFQSIYDTIKDC